MSNLHCALVPLRRDCKFIAAALDDAMNLKINCNNIIKNKKTQKCEDVSMETNVILYLLKNE